MGCSLPKHLVHNEEYLSPSGPGVAQAAACLASTPQYAHVHFSRHVIGLVYTPPKGHKMEIDTAHTGLHMDPIGAACLLLADGNVCFCICCNAAVVFVYFFAIEAFYFFAELCFSA